MVLMKSLMVILLYISLNGDIKEIKQFSAKFIQTVTNSTNQEFDYRGNIYFKLPNKILWRYKTPIIKNVFINDNFVIIDEPELEQAIFSTLDKQIDLYSLIENAVEIAPNLYLSTLYGVEYAIVTKDDMLESIKYQDEIDNDIEIKFIEFNKDIKIDDNIFRFTAPSYYDIIRK